MFDRLKVNPYPFHAVQKGEWQHFESSAASSTAPPSGPVVHVRLADYNNGQGGAVVIVMALFAFILGIALIIIFYSILRCYVMVERKREFGARRKFGRIPSEAHRPPHPDDCEEYVMLDPDVPETSAPAFVFGQSSNAQIGG